MADNRVVILVAEDEEFLLEIYSKALIAAGFEVLQAKNGSEALEWLEKSYESIDLILLDIVMPKMDGFEALEKIKKDERFKKIPILVSTNLDNDEDQSHALGLGAKGYFVKSKHTPKELMEAVKCMCSEDGVCDPRKAGVALN